MLKFLKAVGAVIIGNLITAGIVFAMMLAMLVAIVAAFKPESPEARANASLKDKSVLVLDMNLRLTDTPDARTAGQVLVDAFGGDDGAAVGLRDLTRAIDLASKDKKIRAILIRGALNTEGYSGGYPAVAELRRALLRFRAARKPVTAYLDSSALRDYYLASAADTVIVHPSAEIGLQGLATNNAYFGDALKKYGVGVQTTKVGTYKSAVEPFTSDHMSDADRRQTGELLEGVWNNLTGDIASARHIAPDALRAAAGTEAIFSGADAVKFKLADKTAYLDEVIEELGRQGARDDDSGSFAQIDALDYIRRNTPKTFARKSGDRLAIVYAEGEIVDGTTRENGAFGGEWLASEIRTLRRDDDVKGIVLRVNSPGGSAFASEVARRELDLFRKSGRPVIVSMGTLAASGGYWISAGADRIFAEKTTITGSIGVFGLMFDIRDLAAGFGVKFDGVKTSRFADIETVSRPKSADELALLQKFTDRIYGDFLKIVADGRRLPVEKVAEIAQGRVWSGEAALKLGLVDELGGLGDAVAYARKKSGLADNAPIEDVPGRREPGEVFAQIFQGDKNRPPVARLNGPAAQVVRMTARTLRLFSAFNDRHGVYARMPYLLEMN